MKNWGKLEAIVAAVVIGMVFLVVMVLTGALPGIQTQDGRRGVSASMWGFIPSRDMENTLRVFGKENFGSIRLNYTEKNLDTYEEDLLNAMAGGSGPDIFMMTQDMILKHGNKAYVIPNTVITEREYLNTFVDSADIFLTEGGTLAIPFAVDPMVAYWNKDLFNSAGIALPPRYWSDFVTNVTQLTNKDSFNNIFQSGTAMGEYTNVRNAKDIVSMLILQGGTKIVQREKGKVRWSHSLSEGGVSPFVSALTFYTNFSNPSKNSYSWNRALPNSRDMFLSGKLAMYFGFASEYNFIRKASPHLNFDVTIVPQVENSSVRATYGKVYALSVSINSPQKSGAMDTIFSFTLPEILSVMAEDKISLPPSRRDLIGEGSEDPARAVFYSSTLLARSWAEPGAETTGNLFKDMVEAIVTGRKGVNESVRSTEAFFVAELKKY